MQASSATVTALAAELDPRAMHDGSELLVEGHCLSAGENWQRA